VNVRRLAVVILLLLAAPAQAASYGRGDTGVVNVSNSPGSSEGEEPLAVNPANPAELVTVANVFEPNLPPPLDRIFGSGGAQDTRVYSSRDGGRTWVTRKLDQGGIGAVALPLPPAPGVGSPEFSDAFNIVNTDASSAFDRHGNAYFESGDIHGIHHGGDEQATVWRSSDGGLTWGPPNGYTAVSAAQEHDELDRPWLAIDNSGGSHDGRLYMSFETSPFVDDPPKVFLKHSDDHGRTWSATVRVDAGVYETQYNPRARPVVGPDGAVYVVYDRGPISNTVFTPQQAPVEVAVARSTDGGETFKSFMVDGAVHRVTSPDEATPNYTEMIPAIAADPVHPGWLAVAWPEALGAANSRIVLRYTRDGGAHWSDRVDVADDPASAANQHDHVTLAWLGDGRLFAGWRDRRCCGGGFDANYQQWVRVLSPAGGGGPLVPGRTLEFSAGPHPPTGGSRGALQPDEFQGLVATRLGVGLTWSELNGQMDDLMFRSVPARAFAAAHGGKPSRRPSLRLVVRCARPGPVAAVLGRDIGLVRRVDFRLGARRWTDRRTPFAARLSASRGTLAAVAHLGDGAATQMRRAFTCVHHGAEPGFTG
jgi:hypothetical protein